METPLVAHGRRKNWNHDAPNPPPQSTNDSSTLEPPPPLESLAAPNHIKNNKKLTTVYSTMSLDELAGESTDAFQDPDRNTNYSNYDDDDEDDDNRSFMSRSTASSLASSLRDSLLLPFVDDEGDLRDVVSGLTSLALTGALIGLCMPKSAQLQHDTNVYYPWISSVLGYTYTLLWSACFYPQVLLNYRRQSTQGLSPDFALLNFMGWTFYAVYLSGMFFSHDIQKLYQQRFSNEAKSSVQSNDVLFAVHAALLSFIYLIQIVYYRIKNRQRQKRLIPSCHSSNDDVVDDDDDDENYDKAAEKNCPNTKSSSPVSGQCHHGKKRGPSMFRLQRPTWFLLLAMGLPTVMVPLLLSTGIVAYEHWLDYFYILSYFKLVCTLTKYSQQVRHNFRRQSTQGWNIWYTVLECSGGTLSMLQIVLDSWAMKDWSGITGNLAKFVLGVATLGFDVSPPSVLGVVSAPVANYVLLLTDL